jgi:hypothetical protein
MMLSTWILLLEFTFYLFRKLAKHHSILALVGSIMPNKAQICNLSNGVSKNKHKPCEFGSNWLHLGFSICQKKWGKGQTGEKTILVFIFGIFCDLLHFLEKIQHFWKNWKNFHVHRFHICMFWKLGFVTHIARVPCTEFSKCNYAHQNPLASQTPPLA